ncbi:hypothetical protein N1851_006761 [Merluccius polli]|uniref:Uncharacterized protein n=1 Tax=Merluccius polli TaxID=89951 RepID=A0AA47PA47_MERPO|nr:hypothetical protein N1851_006761 [Merluccius polli]
MFSIVCFDNSEEVEVVPTQWYNNGACRWPPHKAEGVNRAIRQLEEPQDTWRLFDNARVFFSSDNYLECRQKLPLAQNQTDLASEAEDPTTDRRPKRKIKPSRHVRMDFESQDPCSPPKKQAFQNLPKAPAISGPSNIRRFIIAQPTQSGCYEVPVINEEPQGFQHLMTLGSTLRQAIGTSYGGGDMAETGSEEEMVGTPYQGQSVSPGTGTQKGGCDQMCGTLLRYLLVNQQILMDQQKTMIRMIQDLHRTTQGGQRMSTTSRHTAYFPLGDKQGINRLWRPWRATWQASGTFVITLGLAGGADAKDTVWRILTQAIKYDLSKKISWRGMNGKISFENLHLKAVVMGKHFNCSSLFITSILF